MMAVVFKCSFTNQTMKLMCPGILFFLYYNYEIVIDLNFM